MNEYEKCKKLIQINIEHMYNNPVLNELNKMFTGQISDFPKYLPLAIKYCNPNEPNEFEHHKKIILDSLHTFSHANIIKFDNIELRILDSLLCLSLNAEIISNNPDISNEIKNNSISEIELHFNNLKILTNN